MDNQLDNKKKRLNRIKKKLNQRVTILMIVLFIFVLERIFEEQWLQFEENILEWIQNQIGVDHKNEYNNFIASINYLSIFQLNFLLCLHMYVFFFIMVDMIICFKLIFSHIIGMFTMMLINILYQSPRPYWMKNKITGIPCSVQFAQPTVVIFTYSFLIYFLNETIKKMTLMEINVENDQSKIIDSSILNESNNDQLLVNSKLDVTLTKRSDPIQQQLNDLNRSKILTIKILKYLKGFFIILVTSLCIIQYIFGQVFLKYILITEIMTYSYIQIYSLSSDYQDSIIKKTIVMKVDSKRYAIFWIFIIIFAQTMAYNIYLITNRKIDLFWIYEQEECLYLNGQSTNVKYQMQLGLGGRASLENSVCSIGLMGIIIGGQQTFQTNQNLIQNENKLQLLLFNNLALVPSWIWALFLQEIFVYDYELYAIGIDNYIVNSVHFFIISYILFAMIPAKLFIQFGCMTINQQNSNFQSVRTSKYGDKDRIDLQNTNL